MYFFWGFRGTKKFAATSEHRHEYSIFSFKEGALFGRVAEILFMFTLEFGESVLPDQVVMFSLRLSPNLGFGCYM